MNVRLCLFCLLYLAAPALLADEPAGYGTSLFNGENLDGWHVRGCRAGVEEGKLVILEGNGWLRTDHTYRDFVLELEWRPRKEATYDSGIYIRAALPQGDQPWPGKYQVNLKQGDEGNLAGVPEGRSKGLYKSGEWNRLKVTVVGSTAAAEINGKHAWKVDGIKAAEGYIGIQCEEPLGGQFEFRSVAVTELGFASLFNGRDFAGWEGGDKPAESCWKVEDGQLVCTGEPGTWLRSAKQYGDFALRLEYKINSGGNSGVFLRVPKDGNHHGKDAGLEVQILDDRSDRYKDLKDYQYGASLYDFEGAAQHVGRPAGEWNSLEITCRGGTYTITHNGLEVVNASAEEHPALKERLTRGFLGLQNHSEQVWFRNLRLAEE